MASELAKREPRPNALAAMAARYGQEPARILQILKSTIIKATDKHTPTDDEVAAFVLVASQYDLNPFTREIHAFADQQRGVCAVVGIDGWAKIVNAQPDYDGCEFEEHEDEEGRLVSVTCTIYHKSRSHPTKVTEYMNECKRNTTPWTTMPHRLLRHKSFMQCARLAFSLSGVQDEDEAADTLGVPLASLHGGSGKRNVETGTLTLDSLKPAALPEAPATTAVSETQHQETPAAVDAPKATRKKAAAPVQPEPERQPWK